MHIPDKRLYIKIYKGGKGFFKRLILHRFSYLILDKPDFIKIEINKEKEYINIRPVDNEEEGEKVSSIYGMNSIGVLSSSKLTMVKSGEYRAGLIMHYERDFLRSYVDLKNSIF